MRRAVFTVFAFAGAFQFAFRDTSPEMKIEATVLIGVGPVVGLCTTKIMSQSNKNTKDVLQAIANLPQNRA